MIVRVRAWKVRAGDIYVSGQLNWDTLRYGYPHRPVAMDELCPVVKVTGRWIAPTIHFSNEYGTGQAGGWGPMDYVEMWMP